MRDSNNTNGLPLGFWTSRVAAVGRLGKMRNVSMASLDTMMSALHTLAMEPYANMVKDMFREDGPNIWTPRGQAQFAREFSTYRLWEGQVNADFKQWSNARAEKKRNDLKHANDPSRTIEEEMDFLPTVLRTLVKFNLMYNPAAQLMLDKYPMESDGMADILEMVCNWFPLRGELYKPEYNHKFLSEKSDGDIGAVDGDAIVAMFQQPGWEKKKDFPRIILTSSHARGETLNDMRQITHGIEAMARTASGQPLPIARSDEAAKPDQTLMLFACDTERNTGLNAVNLLRRINELRRAATGEEPDGFVQMSPGAKRMAKLMLKCMAENPEDVGDINDGKSIRDTLPKGRHVHLRADAARVAQHFQLIGYSKGGNVVSDAMRYLVSELTARDMTGRDLVYVHNEHESSTPISAFGPHGVRSIVRNIGLMAIAAREVAMSDEMRDDGVRRVAFNNEFDKIAFHSNYPDAPKDENWTVKGEAGGLGHDPASAMGTKHAQGYLVRDPRVARRIKEFMAPHYGKAAVGHVAFVNDPREGDGHCVRIETAAGTSDEVFEKHTEQMLTSFRKAGIRNPEFRYSGSNSRSFELCAEEDFFTDAKAIGRLKAAFNDMRKNHKGLVVAESILREDLPKQAAHITGEAYQPGWGEDDTHGKSR